jgi:long-chain fatty acid transport protein
MNNVIARPKAVAAAVASAFLLTAGQAGASGFQLQEQGASGLGVAYSGMAAAVQDASTAFWNPAGMTYLPGKNVTAAIHYIIPSSRFNDSGSTYSALGSGGQGGESAFVPAMFGTWQLDPRWTVGLAINVPFGLGTQWDSPWAGQYHGVKSEIQTMNINPTVAFKVNQMFSVGLGVSYQQLKGVLTTALPPPAPANVGGFLGVVDADDWAWGWNIGAMIDFRQGTRIGLTYRSSISYKLEGTFDTPPAFAAAQSNVQADVKLPDTFSIGLSHQFNPKLRVLADYTYTGWDSIQSLDIVRTSGPLTGRTLSSTELRFDNSWRIGVGAEYQLNQPWLLRAGIAYDTTPVQDAYRTPRLPDNDRTWLSVGARYSHSAMMSFDFGYTYIWVDDASSQLPNTPPGIGSLNGSYKANVQILAAQVNLRF